MATGKGVIQGYTGAATVDSAHQIIVCAKAHGSGSEQSLLLPMIEQARAFASDTTVMTADAGYHSESNLARLADQGIPDRKSTRLNSSHIPLSRMPSSA